MFSFQVDGDNSPGNGASNLKPGVNKIINSLYTSVVKFSLPT